VLRGSHTRSASAADCARMMPQLSAATPILVGARGHLAAGTDGGQSRRA
jgi:hypothetical protein